MAQSHCHWIVLVVLTTILSKVRGDTKFYTIGHMCNTIAAVDLAIDAYGANAVEMDLRFGPDYNPQEFRHGGFCDCSCFIGGVCNTLGCSSSTPFDDMIAHLATKRGLSLLYVDTKITFVNGWIAGVKLFVALKAMYDMGYQGKILIAVLDMRYSKYLEGFAAAASSSSLASNFYYAYDGDKSDPATLLQNLNTFTDNAFYSWGISACAPNPSALLGNVRKARSLGFKGVGVWTLDKVSSMNKYIDAGATAVVTNHVERLYPVAVFKGLYDPMLRVEGDPIPPPCTNLEADCDYHSGGCKIVLPATPGCFTRCKYHFLWTCTGAPVRCPKPMYWWASWCYASTKQDSLEACRAGGGDCGGY